MQAIKQICDEKNISSDSVLETIEAALAAAYRKDFGEKDQNVKVNFDPETGDFEVCDLKTVVEDMELPEEEEEEEAAPVKPAPAVTVPKEAAAKEKKEDKEEKKAGKTGEGAEAASTGPLQQGSGPSAGQEGEEEEEKRFNPKTEIMISEAKKIKKKYKIGDEIRTDLEVPAAFGRMAAQTAKQVIIQKLREAERSMIFDEFKEREHELVNATVQRKEGRLLLIDLGQATGVMPPDEQVPGERYNPGDRFKVFITEVRLTTKGPEIVVSRSHPEIVYKLFLLEIPEVSSGVVTIHNVAREAGSRSKVSVSSSDESVDPIGSCIGQRGTRIQTIIAELGGEKIDIIQHDEDSMNYITNALSPAKVIQISLNEANKTADVIVSADQLSLAIGKGGQNVRLASRLTGWKINIIESGKETAIVTDEEPEPEEAKPEEPTEEAEKPAEESTEEPTEEALVVEEAPVEEPEEEALVEEAPAAEGPEPVEGEEPAEDEKPKE